jgi:peptide/nickel transport system substrate-binding protein
MAIKSMWKDVGVDVVLDPIEPAISTKKIFEERDFGATVQIYTSYGDPALGFARTFITSAIGRPFGNPTGYSNPEVDELFSRGEKETQPADRAKYYHQAQSIIAKDVPVITIRDYRTVDAASEKLHGAWTLLGPASLGYAWLDK